MAESNLFPIEGERDDLEDDEAQNLDEIEEAEYLRSQRLNNIAGVGP